mmetsp:Transcript_26998/g.49699  ORF Transcript_26998/g.49699 Transcript_26998/m.49699 type:complete len:227 (-) Transcript_26998:3563-4243(-)
MHASAGDLADTEWGGEGGRKGRRKGRGGRKKGKWNRHGSDNVLWRTRTVGTAGSDPALQILIPAPGKHTAIRREGQTVPAAKGHLDNGDPGKGLHSLRSTLDMAVALTKGAAVVPAPGPNVSVRVDGQGIAAACDQGSTAECTTTKANAQKSVHYLGRCDRLLLRITQLSIHAHTPGKDDCFKGRCSCITGNLIVEKGGCRNSRKRALLTRRNRAGYRHELVCSFT